jgi:hypothetical protein
VADEHRAPWDCVLAKDEEGGCLPGTRLKALAGRFKYVGPETADYFLHAVGQHV